MQEKCLNQTGSDAAYGSYLAAEQAFKKCLEADYASFVIDWENSTGSTPLLRKWVDIHSVRSVRIWNVPLWRYCSTRVMIFKCVDDFAEAFQPCHTAEEQRTYEVILNATKVVIHFACENDGAQVIRFSENEGIDCGWERRIGLRQCAQLLAWKWPVLKGTVNPKLVASINARTWCEWVPRMCVEWMGFEWQIFVSAFSTHLDLAPLSSLINARHRCPGKCWRRLWNIFERKVLAFSSTRRIWERQLGAVRVPPWPETPSSFEVSINKHLQGKKNVLTFSEYVSAFVQALCCLFVFFYIIFFSGWLSLIGGPKRSKDHSISETPEKVIKSMHLANATASYRRHWVSYKSLGAD